METTLAIDNATDTGPFTADPGMDPPRGVPVSDLLAYRAGLAVQRYWPPIIVPAGVVGNVLALLVLTRPKNWTISCYVYMAGVAVTDSVMLSFVACYWFLTEIFIDHRVELECKLITWGFQGLSLTGTVLILCMTFDRFLAVCYPLHAQAWCRSKRAKVTVIVAVVVCSAYSFPHFLSSKIMGGDLCVSLTINSTFYSVYSWLNTALNSVVCFILLVVMNARILASLNKKFQAQEMIGSRSDTPRSKGGQLPVEPKVSTRESQLTILLPLISFSFLLLTLPIYIRFVYYLYNKPQSADAENFALYFFASHLTNKLFYTNNAVNCYVYLIAGSKFRKDLCSIFRCKKIS